MKLVHFGDLHLRGHDELPLFERQLASALDERPDHVVISGDLVDRWDPLLLRAVRDLLSAHGLFDPARLTIVHGNHDLASSGGWPRTRADIPRMVLRFWDPPPLLAWRRRRFARLFSPVAAPLPFERGLPGVRLLAIDSTPLPLVPFVVRGRMIHLRTALGRLRASDVRWLSERPAMPSALIVHHWPMPIAALRWNGGRVIVPMHVRGDVERFWNVLEQIDVRLVLCGHVHRTLLERRGNIAVAAQGQSGAAWAGRPFSVYDLGPDASLVSARTVPAGAATAPAVQPGSSIEERA